MTKLGVLVDKKVTYGGLLVFGSEDLLRSIMNHYKIEYLEITGTSYEDAPTRYSFRISSESNLFLTFFEIYERLMKKIDIPFRTNQGYRDDDPPHLQALREALVNFIIHTDYFSQTSPRIRIFLDRFEFYNPGALQKKIDFILKEDFSLPRNPIIAKIFRYIKLAENIGSGFHKMINGWNHTYKHKPVIDGDFDYYKITFPTTTTTKTTTKTREKEILDLIERNPHLTAQDIADKVDLSRDGVRYHIKKLTQRNLINRVGGSKTGRWELKKKN